MRKSTFLSDVPDWEGGVPLLYNIDFEAAAIIFLLIINIFLRIKYVVRSEVNREFRRMALYVLIACALDVATAVAISYGEFIPRVFNLLFNTVYFGMNIAVGYQFTRYISACVHRERRGKVDLVNRIIYVLCFLVLVVNLFTGFVFSFNSEGSYIHGPLYYFVYVFPYYFILFSIGILIFHFKQFSLEQRVSIAAFFILCMVGPLAQMIFFPDVLLSLFTIPIGLLICMFTLETPDYQLLMKTMGELEDLRQQLQQEVERQTERSDHLSLQALKTLAVAIDAKDKYTNGHSVRVAGYARELVKRSGGSEREQEEIYYIGLLHDIGKIGVPDKIINKSSELTDEEFAVMKAHPVIGAGILKNLSMDIPGIEVGAMWHHERYAGGGYPDGLKGDQIPKVARIIGVADAYDTMTSKRSYRGVLPQHHVRSEFVEKSGIQFDPVYAKLMVEMIDEDTEYQMRETDT